MGWCGKSLRPALTAACLYRALCGRKERTKLQVVSLQCSKMSTPKRLRAPVSAGTKKVVFACSRIVPQVNTNCMIVTPRFGTANWVRCQRWSVWEHHGGQPWGFEASQKRGDDLFASDQERSTEQQVHLTVRGRQIKQTPASKHWNDRKKQSPTTWELCNQP